MRGSFIRALPIVAKALSDNYGVAVVIRGNQAQTNGNCIVLPVLPEDDRKAAVLARGYLDHEAAHVKYSDFAVMSQSGFERALTNILEDVRVEQAMGRRYPGCRDNLDALTRLLVVEGDFQPVQSTDPPAAVIQGYLLYLLRSRVLAQQALEPLASQAAEIFEATLPGLRSLVEPIALEVRDAPDTRTVRDISRRIVELLQDAAPPSPQDSPSETQPEANEEPAGASPPDARTGSQGEEQSPGQDAPASPAGEDQEGGDATGNSSDDGNQESNPATAADGHDVGGQAQPPGNTQADGQDAGSQSAEPQDLSPGDQTGGSPGSDSRDFEPEGGDDEPAGDATPGGNSAGGVAAVIMAALADENAYHDIGQTVAGKLNDISSEATGLEMAEEMSPWWTDRTALDETSILQATARLRAMLAGVVQSKRARQERPSLSGTRLNLRGLPRLAVKDCKVFLNRQERAGVNTAVYLLMDQSGSMSGAAIRIAFMSTMALAKALRSISGTAVAAGSFSSTTKDGLDRDYVAPLLRFNESERRMSLATPPAVGGTPMAEAIFCVAAGLLFRPEPRRLLVVLTDGMPDDYEATQEIIGKCRLAGLEVYGVGIMERSVEPLFGKEFALVVHTIEELPGRLFRLLAQRL